MARDPIRASSTNRLPSVARDVRRWHVRFRPDPADKA